MRFRSAPLLVIIALASSFQGCRAPRTGPGAADVTAAELARGASADGGGAAAFGPAYLETPVGQARLEARRFDPVVIPFEEAQPLSATRYVVPDQDLGHIEARVSDLIHQPRTVAGVEQIFYSTGMFHLDEWLPVPDPPTREAPHDGFLYRWQVVGGRTVEVDELHDGEARPAYLVWYDDRGAPVLTAYVGGQPSEGRRYAWADYDPAGLLRRVVEWYEGAPPICALIHVNTPGYESTMIYSFDAAGRLTRRTRHAGNELWIVRLPDPQERLANGGTRVEWLRRLERYGWVSLYPIPPSQ